MLYKTTRFLALSPLFISFRSNPSFSPLSFAKAAFSTPSPVSSASAYTIMSNKPVMIRVIPNDKLHVSEPDPRMFGNGPNPSKNENWTNPNWLKSRFHFSFAEYSNHRNNQYGVLRVLNDDLVQPKRGFGAHPHRDMEILTYIVHGHLTHQDSHGNVETLGRGSIQFMTAGSGIVHSEFNHHATRPLRFIQTWILPAKRSLPPNYGSYAAPTATRTAKDGEATATTTTTTTTNANKNEMKHLVSNVKAGKTTPVQVNQDVNAYVAELEAGHSVDLKLQSGRQAYLLCMEGGVTVNGETNQLKKYDACEIVHDDESSEKETIVTIRATDVEATENGDLAHILIFEMQRVPGSGRTDL
jgi:quercetin 2,3-dioxygenase